MKLTAALHEEAVGFLIVEGNGGFPRGRRRPANTQRGSEIIIEWFKT